MTEKVAIMRPASSVQRNFFPKSLIIFLKVCISFILALSILTLFSFFYANITGHVRDKDGATYEKLTPHAFYASGTEGFSIGRFNNDGYNNLFDYERGMKIDVLIMGSSHMQGFQVMQRYNAANVLGKLSGRIIYNIGMGAHGLPVCISNLEAAAKKYKPEEYIVIEADSLSIDDDTLTRILAGTFSKSSQEKGVIRLLLRRNPYFTLLWINLNNYIRDNFQDKNISLGSSSVLNNSELLSEVLMQMRKKSSEYSRAKIIIAYHPSASLNKNGTLKINCDSELVRQFSDLCTQNGIYFLDMSSRFLDEYEKNYTLPYGFLNTSVGKGHMNQYGHRMFAEEIYKLMNRIEAEL